MFHKIYYLVRMVCFVSFLHRMDMLLHAGIESEIHVIITVVVCDDSIRKTVTSPQKRRRSMGDRAKQTCKKLVTALPDNELLVFVKLRARFSAGSSAGSSYPSCRLSSYSHRHKVDVT